MNLIILKSDDRYSYYQTFADYGEVKQKWVLLLSHKMKEKTLKNKLNKETEKARKSLKKLKGHNFSCEEDTLRSHETWIQDFPSVIFNKIELKSIKKRESGKKGRPLKDEILKTYYEIEAEVKTNDAFVLKEMEKWGFLSLQTMTLAFLLKICWSTIKDKIKWKKGSDLKR